MKNWYTIKAQADDSAEITIFDSIGATWDGEGVTAKTFIADLKAITASKITLLVNSPGGSVFDGLAIYNALLATKAEITGKVMGVAASAASFILMAAKTVVMPENSFLMIHNPSAMAWGDSNDMRDTADWLDKIGDTLVNIYASRTGKVAADIKAMLDAETWLTADEAKAQGFADVVEPAFNATASFEIEKLPEHIRAVFASATPPVIKPTPAPTNTPEPVVPTATLAERIKVVTAEFGLAELAPMLAVDASIKTEADVVAVLQVASEVKALCEVAGLPDKAAALMQARTPVADARAQLCTALAEQDAATNVNTAPKAGSTDPKPKASIDVSAIYDRANANTPLKRSK